MYLCFNFYVSKYNCTYVSTYASKYNGRRVFQVTCIVIILPRQFYNIFLLQYHMYSRIITTRHILITIPYMILYLHNIL